MSATSHTESIFPHLKDSVRQNDLGKVYVGEFKEQTPGLTKRELFAAMAMESALTTLKTSEDNLDSALKLAAKWSVRAADALIAALTDEVMP
jgi:hypothetical protein